MARRRRTAVRRTGSKGPISPPPRAGVVAPSGPGVGSTSSSGSRSGSGSRSRSTAGSVASSRSTTTGAGSASPPWFAQLIEVARRRAAGRVEGLRARFPQATRRELGERLVRSSALRAGLLGAATGTLALIALPIGLPAGVAVTLLLEAELLFALIALYGLSVRGRGERRRPAPRRERGGPRAGGVAPGAHHRAAQPGPAASRPPPPRSRVVAPRPQDVAPARRSGRFRAGPRRGARARLDRARHAGQRTRVGPHPRGTSQGGGTERVQRSPDPLLPPRRRTRRVRRGTI